MNISNIQNWFSQQREGLGNVGWGHHQNFRNLKISMSDTDTSLSVAGGPTIIERRNCSCDDGTIRNTDQIWTSLLTADIQGGTMRTYTWAGGCAATTSSTADFYQQP